MPEVCPASIILEIYMEIACNKGEEMEVRGSDSLGTGDIMSMALIFKNNGRIVPVLAPVIVSDPFIELTKHTNQLHFPKGDHMLQSLGKHL